MNDEQRMNPFAESFRLADVAGVDVKSLFVAPPAVMKAEDARTLVSVRDALQSALARSEEIVEAARIEAEEIREEARKDGRVAGYEEVIVELSRVRQEAAQLQQDAEKDMLDLAFKVAERVLGRAIEMDPDVVVDVVAKSLEHARERSSVVVRVNPADLPMVESSLGRLQAVVEGARLYIEPDDQVARGGCVIDTEAGRIDAQLDVQLEAMRRAIVGDE